MNEPSSVSRRYGARRVILALLTAVVLLPGRLSAAPVAPANQASTFDKVFAFDRALTRSSLQVLIVRGEGVPGLAEVQQGFQQAGIRAELVAAPDLAARLTPGVVVYLTSQTVTPALLEQLARARVLSITGDPTLVEGGRAAVAVEETGGRTQIVVNVERVAAEGHDFQAQMLKVARVVRPAGGATAAATGSTPPGTTSNANPPVLVGFVKPAYPEMARRLRLQGDVVIRLQIDEMGRVTAAELQRGVSDTPGGIDETALQAARNARFRPATRDGKPVPSSYTLTVPFRL